MWTVDNSFKDAVIEILVEEYSYEEDSARDAVHNAAQSDSPTFYKKGVVATAEWVDSNVKFWNVV